jgi:hypothetical protein
MRERATARNASCTDDIWVRISGQYRSSSTIRWRPRTCPSMRRRRVSAAALSSGSTAAAFRPVPGVASHPQRASAFSAVRLRARPSTAPSLDTTGGYYR